MYCFGSFPRLLAFPAPHNKRTTAFWHSLTMTPTSYRGWHVVSSPVGFCLDTAALLRGGYQLAALVENRLADFGYFSSGCSTATQRLSASCYQPEAHT